MSDVIEAMAEKLFEFGYSGEGPSPEAIKEIVAAAEKAGWRLVPVEPTKRMLHAARHIDFDGPEFTLPDIIEAAPRPWDGVKNDS